MATYYVSASATGSGDGSAGNRWTLAQALANAAAGDIVNIAGGTYHSTARPTGETSPVWIPTNSGTAGNPITFQAEDATNKPIISCVVRTTYEAGTSFASNPCFGCNGQDYITWKNCKTPDNSELNICFVNADNCVADGLECYLGSRDGGAGSENWCALRLGTSTAALGTNNMEVKNCLLGNCLTLNANTDSNAQGIAMFYCHNANIHNNEIFNCGSGIQEKYDSENNSYTKNYFRSIGGNAALWITNFAGDCTNLTFKWNVVNSAPVGVKSGLGAPGAATFDDFIIDGNTFYNVTKGVYLIYQDTGWKFVNNIVVVNGSGSTPRAHYLSDDGVPGTSLPPADYWTNRNCYHITSGTLLFTATGSGSELFGAWDDRTTTAEPLTFDPNSQVANPGWGSIGAAADVTEFQLPGGSACLNAGRLNGNGATIHQGAYYQDGIVIGPESEPQAAGKWLVAS